MVAILEMKLGKLKFKQRSEKNTEYKISRLGSSDRGIRITGTTREVDLEKTKSLLDKNFRRLIVETRIEGLKSIGKQRGKNGIRKSGQFHIWKI